MLDTVGDLWVVKFKNNPQHVRVLANEMLATRVAAAVGLTVPETSVVEVSDEFIKQTPELEIDLGLEKVRCAGGLQFGSRYIGGLMPGRVLDYLPPEKLGQVKNVAEFPGMLALDKWMANADSRQAIFLKRSNERRYSACFIDQGYCFHAGEWRFEDSPLRGVYPRDEVYANVVGWESFEPWLTRMETMDPAVVWEAAESIPPEWYATEGAVGEKSEMEILLERLIRRRCRIRELIAEFGRTDRKPFPKWASLTRYPLLG